MSVLNRKVLLLNGDFFPLGVVDMARAVRLVWKGSVQTVEVDPTRVLRSQHMTHEVPSVVRLTRYIDLRKRRRESGKQRFRIFVRDRFKCQYCCKRFSPADLTLDHIIPRSQDGTDDPENLAAACIPCNQRKGARNPDEARMPLLATPSALRYGLDRAMLAHYAESYPDWAPYLCLGKEEKVA
jgi:5-methylcytosine-specific restriction endonuclease McrA